MRFGLCVSCFGFMTTKPRLCLEPSSEVVVVGSLSSGSCPGRGTLPALRRRKLNSEDGNCERYRVRGRAQRKPGACAAPPRPGQAGGEPDEAKLRNGCLLHCRAILKHRAEVKSRHQFHSRVGVRTTATTLGIQAGTVAVLP